MTGSGILRDGPSMHTRNLLIILGDLDHYILLDGSNWQKLINSNHFLTRN